MIELRCDIEAAYVNAAPLAIALERLQECRILAQQPLRQPILDLGCGDGIFAQSLFAEPVDLGIDLDPMEIERSRQSGAYKRLEKCPGSAIPMPDKSFPTIISNSVLEHIPDLLPVLREARRLLTDDGFFLLTVPSEMFERYSLICRLLEGAGLAAWSLKYRAWYNRFWAHHHAYPRETWLALFHQAGLEAAEVKGYGPPFLCTLCDALVPLALPAFLSKRLLGGWIAFPALRRLYAPLLAHFVRWTLSPRSDNFQGGLLFFKLKRSAAE